jgi:hypothetical protein
MAYQTLRSTVVRSSPLVPPYEDRDPLPLCVLSGLDGYVLVVTISSIGWAHAETRLSPTALRLIVVPLSDADARGSHPFLSYPVQPVPKDLKLPMPGGQAVRRSGGQAVRRSGGRD